MKESCSRKSVYVQDKEKRCAEPNVLHSSAPSRAKTSVTRYSAFTLPVSLLVAAVPSFSPVALLLASPEGVSKESEW